MKVTKSINHINPFTANIQGYNQLTILITGKSAKQFSNWWLAHGALAVSFEEHIVDINPIFGEPDARGGKNNFKEIGKWDKTIAKVLFAKNENIEKLILNYFANSTIKNSQILKLEDINNQDWVTKNREQFQPIILNKIAIIASWQKDIKNKTNLIIDPGQAFGSGSHNTTFMILQWLENNHNQLINKKIIDYGCGSGILGIAAAKFGADVWLTDIDKVAIEISKENAKINQVKIQIISANKCKNDFEAKFDIVIANILLLPIIQLQEIFYKILKPQGLILITGILENQFASVLKEYKNNFSQIKIINQSADWILVSALK